MTETRVCTVAELEAVIGTPSRVIAEKARPRLHALDRQWLAASPFCILATSGRDGSCDASPKGDPAGSLVHVLDDRTVAIAERPGNKRVDGYRNVLENPHVGIVSLIPGRGDTLRINGAARLVSDAPWFDELAVRGTRPILALVVEVEEVFHHCAKAFLRSGLWEVETWNPTAVASTAELVRAFFAPQAELADIQRDVEAMKDYVY